VTDIRQPRVVDWMRELSVEEQSALQRASVSSDHDRGGMVFAPDSEPNEVYHLERGLVRIYRLSNDGAETTFGYVAPGEVFGELPAFGGFPRESFAMAVHPSRVWRIPTRLFQKVLLERPAVALEITRQIGQRMKRIESRVERLVFRDVRARLAGILLELSEDFGLRRGEKIEIQIELTQAELATLVGSTRQTVNSGLGELEQAGLIERAARRLVVVDPAGLLRIARAGDVPA
jgi:CRP-like cAMP-binding protein